jgi:hypothetical protein
VVDDVAVGLWAAARGEPEDRLERVGRGRTLAEFQKEFPDEASCAAFLSARRWPDGFVCPACGRGRAVALKSRPRPRRAPPGLFRHADRPSCP